MTEAKLVRKPHPIIKTVTYKGEEYEVNYSAMTSIRYQRRLANAERDVAAYWDALDVVCCGRLDEYQERIPEPDGEMGEYGTSIDGLNAFITAATEQAAAKN
jgi:hypothetical protein